MTHLGYGPSAIQTAQAVAGREQRDSALSLIASIAASKGRYDWVEAAIKLMGGIGMQQEHWRAFARGAASDGQYDAALRLAGYFTGNPYDVEEIGDWEKARLLEFIADARRTGRRKEVIAEESPKPIRHRIRDLGGDWGARDRKNVAAFRELVNSPGHSPAHRVCAWYFIALAHYRERDIDRCRQAIRKAAADLAAVGDTYKAVLYTMVIATLLLDVGDTEDAQQLVQKMLTPEAMTAVLEARDDEAVKPKVVSVLVTLGDVERAWEFTKRAKRFYESETWWAFGACCALHGKPGEVEKRLRKIESEKHKALLCIGVAAGLHELWESKKAAPAATKLRKCIGLGQPAASVSAAGCPEA